MTALLAPGSLSPVNVGTREGIPYLLIRPQSQLEGNDISRTMQWTQDRSLLYGKFTQRLKKILESKGYDVPPLDTGYTWPGKVKPWDHQKETTRKMLEHLRIWILNEPRTGKTLSSIHAMFRLMQTGDVKKVLILCPKTIMRSSWLTELFWVMPHQEVYVADKSVKALDKVIRRGDGGPDIIIANHDKVKLSEGLHSVKWDLIVVDEASKFKHHRSDRSSALRQLVKHPGVRLWALTGTAVSTAPTDCWHMGRLINPTLMPRRFTQFRDMTMFQIGMGWKARAGWKQTVAEHMKPSYRVLRTECFQVPPISYTVKVVAPTAEQTRVIKQLKKGNKGLLNSGAEITAMSSAVELQKIFQVAGGVVYDRTDKSRVLKDAVNKRVQALMDIQAECGGKVIVVCPFTEMHNEYVKELGKQTGKPVLSIQGKTSPLNRQKAQDEFRTNPDALFFVAHPEVVQFGINASTANTTAYVSCYVTPEQWTQTNDRMFAEISASKQKLDVVMLACCKAEYIKYQSLFKRERGAIEAMNSTELYKKIFND